VLFGIANGTDDVAFHDLHVVDVVDEFYARRSYGLANLDSPGGMVCMVVRVIDFTV
jgi:hypothetical protein